jgi:hypothetical protein
LDDEETVEVRSISPTPLAQRRWSTAQRSLQRPF